MSETKPRRLRPRSFTKRELAKVDVDLANPHSRILCCKKCYRAWIPMIQIGGKLPRGYWKCPEGCHD